MANVIKNHYSFPTLISEFRYDIPEEMWSRIKLSNINCGRTIFGQGIPANRNIMAPVGTDKNMDICAIFQGNHPECYDHKVRNDRRYTRHRSGLWNKLEKFNEKYKCNLYC